MPLVIVSGLPQSGKSSAARILCDYLRGHIGEGANVEVISEADYGCDPVATFSSADLEKKARGNFISAIERRVNRNNIVIADGLNYIKGYRYQLHCIARAAATPHCVLYCAASEQQVRERNNNQVPPKYPPSILEELLMRYEEPSDNARWDNPLFTITSVEEMDGAAIMQALLGGTARPPSMATLVKLGNSAALLTELDKITINVVERIMTSIKEFGVPTRVDFPNGLYLIIKKPLGMSDLQQLRRQFIVMNRLHQANVSKLEDLFISYLENNLE